MTDEAKPENTDEDKTVKRRPVARGTSLRRPASGDADRSEKTDLPESPGSAREAAEPAEGAEGAEGDARAEAPSGRGDRLRIGILAAAALLAILAIVGGVLRFVVGPVDNRAYVDTELTSQVTSVARQAAKQIYTIDMNDLGPWERKLGDVLTPGMVDEAKKLGTAITQAAGALKDVKVKVDDADLTAGVSLARADHAEVLLNITQQATAQGVPVATSQSPMKFVLDRFDGVWKISSITPL
ncbi:hypothetical protein GCM10027289_12060 [Tsukamurella serpentis]